MFKKIGLMISLLLLCLVTLIQPVSARRILFDDFTGNIIDDERWNEVDSVKDIYIQDGQLHASFSGYAGEYGMNYLNLPFVSSESIYAIKATVTVHEINDAPDLSERILLSGNFYSDSYGDVWIEIGIYQNNNGLYASWTIFSNGSGKVLAQGTLQEGLQYNVPYELSLSYNVEDNLFVFSIDGYSATSEGIDKQGEPNVNGKGIGFGVWSSDAYDGPASISASIDNVFINNESVVYDDFTASTIDTTKWQQNSSKKIVQIENNGLHLYSKGNDLKTSTYIGPVFENDSRYLEAEVIVNESTYASDGAWGKVRIGRIFYNDTYGPEAGLDYNGDLGEVWSEIHIRTTEEDSLVAKVEVYRADDASWNTETKLFDQVFPTVIEKDKPYSLSMEFTGTQLIFKCNDDSIIYDIETPAYTPKSDYNYDLTSRVYLDPGEEGIFDATIDNVYIKQNDDASVIDWADISIDRSKISSGFSINKALVSQLESAVLTGPDSYSESFDLIEDYNAENNMWQKKFDETFSYGNYTLTLSFLDGYVETFSRELLILVLNDQTPNTTITAQQNAIIFGSSSDNQIVIQSGGKAESINFPGENTFTIQEDAEFFIVSRSGTIVTFESEDNGTILKIPATRSAQKIVFNDRTLNLIIEDNKVLLGNQAIESDQVEIYL